jgi:hypothetical protein
MNKLLPIIFIASIFVSGCATKPSKHTTTETGRKMGVSVYKAAEGEIYREFDGMVSSGTRQIIHVLNK